MNEIVMELTERVRRTVDEHASGKDYLDKTIWQLVLCEEWHRMFVDGSS